MIAGPGLHSGAWGNVSFEKSAGPVRLRTNGVEVSLPELVVVAAERSTTIGTADGRVRVGTIEHVFAALGGLGLHEGVTIVLDGPEAPLADGGARAYAEAVRALDVPPSPPRIRVAREGLIELGESRYEFVPGDDARIEVELRFDHRDLARHAAWPDEDFFTRIAPARTFGFEHEIGSLLARGLASHVTPESVVVIGENRILAAGAPFENDEPARHKLLDLIGDLFLYGGAPLGTVRAFRPGHALTHEAMRRAFSAGFVEHVTPV